MCISMNEEEIIAFIKKHIGDATPEAIKDALVSSGVSEENVQAAWNKVVTTEKAPSPPPSVSKDTSWDEHIFGTAESSLLVESVPQETAPVPPAAPAAKLQTEMVSKKRHSTKVPALLIILASFIFGGGAFAYWSFIEPRLQPNDVLAKMASALKTIKAGTESGTVSVVIEQGEQRKPGLSTAVYDMLKPLMFASTEGTADPERVNKIAEISVSFSGGFDGLTEGKRKSAFKSTIAGSAMGNEFSLGMDVRTINHVLFAKVDNVSQFDTRFKKLESQWIKADFDTLSIPARSDVFATSTEGGQVGGKKIEDISMQVKEKMTALFKDAHVLNVIDSNSDTAPDGVVAYHYVFEVDKEGLKKFIDDAVHTVYAERLQLGNDSFGSWPATEDLALDDLHKALAAFQDIQGELWVGKKDFLPHQAKLHVSVSDPKTSLRARLDVALEFSHWNESLSVTAPTTSTPIEEILAEIGFMWGSQGVSGGEENSGLSSADEQRVTDVHALALALELYKNDNHDKAGYPEKLSSLGGLYIAKVPVDPVTGQEYAYAVSADVMQYHVGTTLDMQSNIGLDTDQDFDSKAAAYVSGFVGIDTIGCDGQSAGACYDITSP